jgi:hypothetical protein
MLNQTNGNLMKMVIYFKGARLMKKYLVKVYNKVDNGYRIAMETTDLNKAEDKMDRLSNQGHLVKIDLKPNETPEHLKDVPKDKLETLVEIFKSRI